MKLPDGGQGYWAAFWMLGAPFRPAHTAWPTTGEIDVMEAIGSEPGTVHGTLHCGVATGGICQEPTGLGGAGNTGRPDSFDVALDGSRFPGLESLRYHLGVTRESVNSSDERVETGVTAALSYEFKLTPRIAMTPFVEFARFDNFGGANGERRDYVVSAVEFDYRKYALSFVAAPRRVAVPGEAARWDLQYSTTLSYTIMPRLVVSAGYLRTRNGGQVENTVGTAVNYVLRY